jgi:hypothetical protein
VFLAGARLKLGEGALSLPLDGRAFRTVEAFLAENALDKFRSWDSHDLGHDNGRIEVILARQLPCLRELLHQFVLGLYDRFASRIHNDVRAGPWLISDFNHVLP